MSLRRQAVGLTIMHAADVLQPLLLLPYAGRVLGAHAFGEYAYAVSIGQFAATFVEYGFHWTAQRAAAAARNDANSVARLFAEVLLTKLALGLLVAVVGLAAAGNVLAISRPLFLCALTTAIGGIFFPAWLLIGLERGWQAAVATVLSRILTAAAFVLLVRSPEQLALAVALQCGIPLICAAVSLPFVAGIGLSALRYITPSGVARQLRLGWRAFLYTLVERLSMTLPVILVERFDGYAAAGQYSVAEKFVSATRPSVRILSDTFLPRVAFLAGHDRRAGLKLIGLSLLTLFFGAGLSLGLFFVAPFVVTSVFGPSFAGAIPIIRLMAIIPLLLNISACTSNLYMFNYGHERAWSMLVLASLFVFIGVAYGLLMWLPSAAEAVSLAVVAKEAIVVVVSSGFLIAFGLGGKSGILADETKPRSWHAGKIIFPAILRTVRGRLPSAK